MWELNVLLIFVEIEFCRSKSLTENAEIIAASEFSTKVAGKQNKCLYSGGVKNVWTFV